MSRFDTYKGKGYAMSKKEREAYSAKRGSARRQAAITVARQYNVPMAPALFGSRGGLKAEVKTIDLPQQINACSQTAIFTLLNPIQEGSSFYNRIGRKICLRSIRLTGQICPRQGISTPGGPDYLRVMIIYDRQTNGNFPTFSDVLTSYDNTGATTSTCQSHLNMNNTERFKVVRDIRISISSDAVAGANIIDEQVIDYKGKYNIDEYSKLRGYETHYKASSNPAVIGDISTGGLYLMTVGGNVVGSAGYSCIWTSRCRYTDV